MVAHANQNGSERQQELRDLRTKNRLAEEKLRAKKLEQAEYQQKQKHLREWWQTDWINPYLDAMTTGMNQMAPFGVASFWQRKHGNNYPIYRTEQELNLLRFPSRWLAATNTYAQGFIGGLGGYILGGGLTYRVVPRNKNDQDAQLICDTLQTVVDEILEQNEWYGGELPGFEQEYFERTLEDGEGTALHYYLEDGFTQFRFAEPEQMTMPPGKDLNEWSYGVRNQVTPHIDVERPLGYWITWSENKSDGEEFTPDRVTHFRRNVKRSSKRGVPEFSFDMYESMHAASTLRANSGEAAAQQAAIVAVMEFKSGNQSDIQAVANAETSYYDVDAYSGNQVGVAKTKKGTRVYIPESQRYTTGPAANNAEAHSEILQMLLRSACVRWNAPEWFGSGDASNNNRASGRSAVPMFINRVTREQRRYCSVYRRMIMAALKHAVETRRMVGMDWDELVKAVDLKVQAPNPVEEDKLTCAQVAAIEIPLGVQSRQNYAQEQGRDWGEIEQENEQYEAEHPEIPGPADAANFMASGDDEPAATDEPVVPKGVTQ